MTNNEILTEYFIWEENNSIEPKMKSENKTESEPNDSMTNTKIVNELENWKTITDPKLRKKMYQKMYREDNKDKISDLQKKWYGVNKEKSKKYYQKNKEKILIQRKSYGKQYRKLNKNKIYEYRKKYKKKNIEYKLGLNLRTRLCNALQRNTKSGSAVRDLGCTIEELKVYLESKFQTGMTWDNYGLYGWHIDHIKPLASFDLTDRKQMLEACHYTNLQPLWAKDNLTKGDK
jgi:hypothetical protein